MDSALMPPRRFLNVGCGRRFHPSWVNIDIQSSDPQVTAHDIRGGLGFPDASFEVVYHSHVLEHLAPHDGLQLLRECYRVLKPGGTIRVAVPDLEQIARLYLKSLELARQGHREWQDNYDWMMIELYDQTVREMSGGGHGVYLNRDDIPNVDFVLMRQGKEAEESIAGQRRLRTAAATPAANGSQADSPHLVRRALRVCVRRLRRMFSPGQSRAGRESRIQRAVGPQHEIATPGRVRRA